MRVPERFLAVENFLKSFHIFPESNSYLEYLLCDRSLGLKTNMSIPSKMNVETVWFGRCSYVGTF